MITQPCAGGLRFRSAPQVVALGVLVAHACALGGCTPREAWLGEWVSAKPTIPADAGTIVPSTDGAAGTTARPMVPDGPTITGEPGVPVAGMAGDASAPMPPVAGAAGGAMNTPPQASAACLKNPTQVMLLGDGYLAFNSHTFPADLAREVGVTYRNEVKSGAGWMTGAPAGLNLPQVYGEAVMRDSDLLVVIMTGGGDDIYFPTAQTVASWAAAGECKNNSDAPDREACQEIVAAAMDAAETLLATMAEGGVKDVIYLGYPHIPSGPFSGTDPSAVYNYLSAMTKSLCEGTEARTSGKLRCHFLDLVPIFDGHVDWFSTVDSYYPNAMGSAAMAEAVAKLLKDECIAQDVSSGCCY